MGVCSCARKGGGSNSYAPSRAACFLNRCRRHLSAGLSMVMLVVLGGACLGRDSNSHARRGHQGLDLARLPFRHRGVTPRTCRGARRAERTRFPTGRPVEPHSKRSRRACPVHPPRGPARLRLAGPAARPGVEPGWSRVRVEVGCRQPNAHCVHETLAGVEPA